MDAHLDTHFDHFPRAWPVVAQVKAVVCKDDARNITGTYTLYDVTAYPGRPSTTAEFEMVPCLGQNAANGDEDEDPLPIGAYVMLGFRDGDPNLPFILGTFPWHDTAVAQESSEQPHTRRVRRSHKDEIDKDGNRTITLAAQKSIKVKDSAGVTLLEVVYTGAVYEVHLGGDSGLKRLMTEDMVAALGALFSAVIIVPGDGGAALKTALTTGLNGAFTTANSTVTAKAK